MAICLVGVGCDRLAFYVFLLTNAGKVWQNKNKGWLFFASLSNVSSE